MLIKAKPIMKGSLMIPTYENQLVRLREPRLTDANELLRITNDPEVMKYYGMEPYQELTKAEEEINWFLSLFKENCGGRWVIADKITDQYIGDIGLFHFQPKHNRIEIGFKLKKEYWRKGIMSFSIREILHFGFHHNHYNRIEALVDKRNVGCLKTLERCGFQREGLLREYECEYGHYVDLYMLSMLKSEYSNRL